MLCCLEGSRNRSLSHGHFAGLYYWLIAFELSPLRAFLLSGDCLLVLERTRLALATQLCCTLLLSHVACNVLSPCLFSADLLTKQPLWDSRYLTQRLNVKIFLLVDILLHVFSFIMAVILHGR